MSSSSSPPAEECLVEIILPPQRPPMCCSCRGLIGEGEFRRADDPATCAEWAAWLHMLVPLGAIFCVPECWATGPAYPPHPKWASQMHPPVSSNTGTADGARLRSMAAAAASSSSASAALVVELPVRTRSIHVGAVGRAAVDESWNQVREKHRASYHLSTQLQRANAHVAAREPDGDVHMHDVAAPPAGGAAPAAPPVAADTFFRLQLEHQLERNARITSTTGAPTADEFVALVHLMFPRAGGRPATVGDALAGWPQLPGANWQYRKLVATLNPMYVALVALTKLRQDVAYEALAAMYGLSSKSVAWRMTKRCVERLSSLATDAAHHRGAVRFLTPGEIAGGFPERFRKYLPNLTAIGDCFPVYIQDPSHTFHLHTLLYDGEDKKGSRLVKFFLLVAPNGYVMYVGGPYAPAGKAADGRIVTYEMLRDDAFWQFAQRHGVWLFDFGFRGMRTPPNVVVHLPKKWPTGRRPGARSATQRESDHNTIVCSARWVVEAANERVENFRILHGRHRAFTEIKRLRAEVVAVCFLFNRWNKPIA